MKRLTALVLSLIMVIGCFAFTVSAEESDNNNWAADKDAKYTASVAKELGADIAIESFVLFEKGEGLEKREDDFAEEIAKLTGKA